MIMVGGHQRNPKIKQITVQTKTLQSSCEVTFAHWQSTAEPNKLDLPERVRDYSARLI